MDVVISPAFNSILLGTRYDAECIAEVAKNVVPYLQGANFVLYRWLDGFDHNYVDIIASYWAARAFRE